EARYKEPESPFAESLGHHAATHLRYPVVRRTDEGEQCATAHDVMEVGHDEVGVMHLLVERRDCHHDARDAAQEERHQEGYGVHQCRSEADLAAPERGYPVEYLDARGHTYDERGHREHTVGNRTQ